MTDLLSLLPQPKHVFSKKPARESAPIPLTNSTIIEPPSYGQRASFLPRTPDDFGDGGAFPEIHIMQYPLDMGRRGGGSTALTRTTPLQVDSSGAIKYDIVLRQNMRKDVTMYSTYNDLVERDLPDEQLVKPSAEEEQKTAERTRAALAAKIAAKLAVAQPKKEAAEPVFIRYTPSASSSDHNSGASQRIIRLQEMPQDPLEPPKYKHKKLPGGPPSPPPPVMHSPPRKITAQDQANWKIPPCVSNWKNIKGYTIPLDKRLATDGRGLQEVQINDRFAKLSESLLVAERTARKEIEERANMARTVLRQQKADQEGKLRDLAAKARAGARTRIDDDNEDRDQESYDDTGKNGDSDNEESEASIADRDAREELRKDRKREIKHELRKEQIKNEARKAGKSAVVRDEERDVSEKIALGQAVKGGGARDGGFDQRLFNQAQGMDAGFAAEDDYGVYDKPLFKGGQQTYIYRAKKDGEGDLLKDAEEVNEKDAEGRVKKLLEKGTARFQPDKGFKGTEDGPSGHSRSQPVQFEKESEDLFGLGELLGEAKQGKRSLDNIGGRGHMGASAGGASSRSDDYDTTSTHSRNMVFEEASEETSSSSSSSRGSRRGRDDDSSSSSSKRHKR